jgi:hypothetical protein
VHLAKNGLWLLALLAPALQADMFSFSYTDGPTGVVAPGQDIVIRITVTNDPTSTHDIVQLHDVSLQFSLTPLVGNVVISDNFVGTFPVGDLTLDIAPGESETFVGYFYHATGGVFGSHPPDGTVFSLLSPGLYATYSSGGPGFTPSLNPPAFSRTISSVPEPISVLLLSTTATMLFVLARRKRL